MFDRLTKVTGRMLASPAGTPAKARFVGVDVARGIALISMLAANTFAVLNDNGTPTLAAMTVTGRSATLFVMVAGISLAFITGGRNPVQGRACRTTAVGIVVRVLLIGAIGLALGYFAGGLDVILPVYALLFLLAIPLLGLRSRTLACIAGVLVVVDPLLLLGAFSLGLRPAFDSNPMLSAPFTNPIGFVLQLLVTGPFPAVVYMVYICAGLAIGRLDLSSTRVVAWLLGGGLVMAVTAWETSGVLLFHLGDLQHLQAAADPVSDAASVTNQILRNPNQVASWWWLALRAHHSGTPIDALHTLGSAMAVLGGVLLVTKLRGAQRLLWSVGVAGTMTLTIYSVHALVLNSGLLSDNYLAAYVEQGAGALVFAVVWYRFMGQGPLERKVAMASGRARRAVMGLPPRCRSNPDVARNCANSKMTTRGDGHDLDRDQQLGEEPLTGRRAQQRVSEHDADGHRDPGCGDHAGEPAGRADPRLRTPRRAGGLRGRRPLDPPPQPAAHDLRPLGYKFVLLAHNTIRGVVGGSVLNAELCMSKGLVG